MLCRVRPVEHLRVQSPALCAYAHMRPRQPDIFPFPSFINGTLAIPFHNVFAPHFAFRILHFDSVPQRTIKYHTYQRINIRVVLVSSVWD